MTLNLRSLPPNRRKILLFVIVFSVLFRLAATEVSVLAISADPRSDIDTWKTTASLVADHKNIYTEVSPALRFCRDPHRGCYNFGPAWAWISLGLDRLSGLLPIQPIAAFRFTLTAFLATVDVLVALVLAADYSFASALVFLLAPPLIWIEVFQGPFNNLGLLFGLLSWRLIRKPNPPVRSLFFSSALMGISLAIKHIFAIFPVWLLFYKPLGRLRDRLVYTLIAYGIFWGSFLPWWFDPASRAGILERVFGYKPNYETSVLTGFLKLFAPIGMLDRPIAGLPVSTLKLFWLLLLIAVGILASRRKESDIFLCYLVALYAFSIGLWEEYLVIPMLACAIFYRSWASWAFFLAVSLEMLIHESTRINAVHPFLQHLPHVFGAMVRRGWNSWMLAGEWCTIVLFFFRWRDGFRSQADNKFR